MVTIKQCDDGRTRQCGHPGCSQRTTNFYHVKAKGHGASIDGHIAMCPTHGTKENIERAADHMLRGRGKVWGNR